MSFPRYPEYKSSSTDFIGEVPVHWKLHRLKHCAEVFPSNVDKKSVDGQIPVQLCNYTDVYYNDTIEDGLDFMSATATEDQARRFELQQNDVVFTKDSESSDDIGIAAFVPQQVPGVIYGYHLSIARANGSSAIGPFLKKYFDSQETKSYFDVSANGLTRVGLGQYAVDNAPIVLPSINEQAQIARFLDHETAKIDALIREQERLIELLQEKRQAVISHAVTKGLDPDVPMKDSGVEWLGEVPEHWEVVKFGLTHNRADLGGNYSSGEGLGGRPLIKMGNISRGKINLNKVERLSLEENYDVEHLLNYGDFLFNTRNSLDLVGKVCVWRNELSAAAYNSNILKIDFVSKLVESSFYMNHLFNSNLLIGLLRTYAKGTTSVAAIYYKDLQAIPIPLPPKEEQVEIVYFVDAQAVVIDDLIAEALDLITLMKERRSVLISAAVTGKIDVRDWQPPTDEMAFNEEVRQAGVETTA
ncbi:MAG: restriction endonuclease subunit S [Marinobacter sp.]|nr:restriction endonuclease subunit S [Marinobacter sp.]